MAFFVLKATLAQNATPQTAAALSVRQEHMEILPDAKMVDIKIVEVPFCWSGFAPDAEIGARENTNEIKLSHTPSGIQYVVGAPESVSNSREAAELRAKAKIQFIHELHGESWLNE